MTSERDTTRIVRSCLEQGVTDLPHRVLDSVLDQLPATPQHRFWWSARRLKLMNSTFKLGIAAAAVILAGVIVFNLPGAGVPGVGAPGSASPSQDPSQRTPSESTAVPNGPMAAGRYHTEIDLRAYPDDGGGNGVPGGRVRITYDVPAGWSGLDGWAITKAGAGTSGELAWPG